MSNIPIGWLGPDGRLIECGYQEHLAVAEDIAVKLGAPEGGLYDEYLLNHGWCHLTVMMFMNHGWAVIFPYSDRITREQHDFLKPYVEDNLDFIADGFETNLKYEFPDLFDLRRGRNGPYTQ